MKSFELVFRPKIFFGNKVNKVLTKEINGYKNILIIYGQGSIKRNGLYEEIVKSLNNKEVFEYPGITPNPKLSDIERAINLCKEKDIDLIIAAGGGSVMDAAKAISLGSKSDHKMWDIIVSKEKVEESIDIFTIPTMIATGSETNDIFVVYNDKLNLKRSLKNNLTYPKVCIADPTLTTTINKRHTINGIVDTLSHIFEQYINEGDNEVVDKLLITYFSEMIKIGKVLVNNLEDEKLRSDHMYIAMQAYNGDYRSMVGGDFACHGLDYGVASLFNNFHGEGLSILTIAWLEYIIDNKNLSLYLKDKIKNIFLQTFEYEEKESIEETIKEGIRKLKEYFIYLGAPTKFSNINIEFDDVQLLEMIEKSQFVKPLGNTINLTEDDIKQIYLSAK